ncbi:hypothetical protein FQN57_002749 [Myotisia sp. PD_48]|nr:hypothetical protein FQN57_002749 [Myotisia sp. PD_48]
MPSGRRKRDAATLDDDDDDELESQTEKSPERVKKSKTSDATTKTDANGDMYWEISRLRRVTVSTFKGRVMVHIREFYEKDGQELPGKKGISLTLEQFNMFSSLLPEIGAAIEEKGGTFTAPNISTSEKRKPRRKNYEATSSEEE